MASVLGYDTIGGSVTGGYSAPVQLGCKFTAGATDVFDEVVVWLQASTITGNFKVALFEDSVGTPGTLLYSSGAITGTLTTTGAWCTCPLNGSITSGTTYWIVVSCNVNFIMAFDGGGANQAFDDYTAYPTFNNPYISGGATPDSYYSAVLSVYLNKTGPSGIVSAWLQI